MKLELQFFDKEEWSMYGTLNVLIPFIPLLIIQKKITSKLLILCSIMGLLKGKLLPRLLFVLGISGLVFENNIDWIIQTIILLISTVIIFFIPYNNFLHKITMNNIIVNWIMKILIFIWMSYILYNIAIPFIYNVF